MMKTIRSECSILKRIMLRHKIECCIIAVVTLIGLCCFRYIDGMSLTAWSVEIWDTLFLRGIENIREVFAENVRNAPHGGAPLSGDILLASLPLSIWNLPLWLTHTFGGNTDVLSTFCLAWSKLFFVFCALLAGLQCYHLVYGMNKREERAELAAIAFCGSGTLMLSVGMAMQNEIVYVLTFLLALRCICDGRKTAGLTWMVLTVTFAPFMILAVLVVLLFMSKNILKVFAMAIATSVPYALSRILLPPLEPSSDDYLDWFFNRTTIQTGIGVISIFAVVILAILAVSYFKRYDDNVQQCRALIYDLTVLIGAMCIVSWQHVYRLFICVPFLIVSILGVDEIDDYRIKASLLIFAGFELLRTMSAFFPLHIWLTHIIVRLGFKGFPVFRRLTQWLNALKQLFREQADYPLS